jgi:alpha-L-rhamnosidase
MGATTIWERWDGQKTDSTFQDEGMNSFNHYAYGAIGDWMYRVSAGIETQDPGYRNLILQPHPAKNLSYAKASFESSYGTIASGWTRKDGKIIVHVIIPANTKATVMLPVDNLSKIMENGHTLLQDNNDSVIMEETREGKRIGLKRGSGDYSFEFAE